MSKYRFCHIEVYGDFRSKDLRYTIEMRITNDTKPCSNLIVGLSSTNVLQHLPISLIYITYT